MLHLSWKALLRYKTKGKMAEKTNKVDLFKCFFCTKLYCYERNLQQHIRECHAKGLVFGWLNHRCLRCRKSFQSSRTLDRHQKTVHGFGVKQAFQCNICSAFLSRKDSLKRHIQKVHGREVRMNWRKKLFVTCYVNLAKKWVSAYVCISVFRDVGLVC